MKHNKHLFFEYERPLEIKIGDVLVLRSDIENPTNISSAAFNTEIVYDIDADREWVKLARPHARAKKVGCCRGDFSVHVERHSVPVNRLMDSYFIFTDGGDDKDNRGEVI